MSHADYALVIGIDRYPELGDNLSPLDLQGPGNDADMMAAWFESQNVHVLAKIKGHIDGDSVNPTRSQIETELKRIHRMSRQNQAERRGPVVGRRLYIYLSGHGFSPARRRGCIFTADANSTFADNVYISGWLDWFSDAGYFREFVLWMDCCMNRSSQLPPQGPSAGGQSERVPPNGVFIAFAAQRPLRAVEVPIPEDGGAWHGAFTWTLLEGLKGAAVDANGLVTSRSLGDWLRNAQSRYISPGDLNSALVSREPDIEEDSKLVFVRGVSPKCYPVTLSFDAALAGARANLWSGRPPRPEPFDIAGPAHTQELRPGLYVVEVPGHQIRQGFEVVGPTAVKVRDSGQPVSPGKEGQIFSLEVVPADQPAEIYIIDTAFSLVDAMAGQLTTPLYFGLYKIKVRVGNQIKERVILLDRDRPPLEQGDIAPALAAAAPLPDTALGHEYQAGAALSASRGALELAATKNRPVLMLMARVWSEAAAAAGREPWAGITVVDNRGKVVLDLAGDSARSAGETMDPYAVAMAALKPGVYFLRRPGADGTQREQALVLSEGWTLEAYILRHVAPADGEASRSMFSLHMRKLDGAAPDLREDRMLEAAYSALADERRVFSGEIEQMLLTDLRNPMLGIVGAHLFLLEAERSGNRDLSPLNGVVRNLRDLVGDRHPDVEALSLKCTDQSLRTQRQITRPPIFLRSWNLMVDATRERQGLIRRSVWDRVVAVRPRPLYLTWFTNPEIKEATREKVAEALWIQPTDAAFAEAPAAAMSLEVPPLPGTAGPASGVKWHVQSEMEHIVDLQTAQVRALRLMVPLSVVDQLRPIDLSGE
ncbi:caspase family protein [Pseudochelatococcus sp. B33]